MVSAPDPTGRSLLVLIDPAARRADGEAVRIARDVLSAAAATKICLPESAAELTRALSRPGGRRPVVIGDDRAFLRVVSELRRQETLADAPLSLVPVGTARTLAATLGVPTGTVAAARTVLDGEERRLGLLVDDGGGVVLDALRLPAGGGAAAEPGAPGAGDGRGEQGGGAGAAEGARGGTSGGTRGSPLNGPGGAVGPAGGAPAGAQGGAASGRSGPNGPSGGASGGPSGGASGPLGGSRGGPRGGPLAGLAQRAGAAAGGPGRRWTPAAGLRALAARAVGQRNGTGREPGPPPAAVAEWGAEETTEGWESGAAGTAGAGRPAAAGPGAAEADDAGWPPAAERGTEEWDGAGWPPAASYDVAGLDATEYDAHVAPEGGFRLRVEADGVLLAELDGPVAQVTVVTDPASGLAQVEIHPRGGDPLHTQARSVRVWGTDFRYRADALLSPPIRQRTWTATPNALRLITAPTR